MMSEIAKFFLFFFIFLLLPYIYWHVRERKVREFLRWLHKNKLTFFHVKNKWEKVLIKNLTTKNFLNKINKKNKDFIILIKKNK